MLSVSSVTGVMATDGFSRFLRVSQWDAHDYRSFRGIFIEITFPQMKLTD